MRRYFSRFFWMVISFMALTACGGGNAAAPTDGATLNVADVSSISGKVLAPNGVDPVAGVTLYIPQSTDTTKGKGLPKITIKSRWKSLTGADGITTCDNPPETACAQSCSSADGGFLLDLDGADGCAGNLVMVKGKMSKTIPLTCSTPSCLLGGDESTFSARADELSVIPKIAVVTGNWDMMQDVLAKLGLGVLDANGRLDTNQPYSFTIFDGQGYSPEGFESFEKLLDGSLSLSDYDIIFINCGTSLEHMLDDAAVRKRLREYVEEGGTLYVTDRSYDYIEQPFPEFAFYYGDPKAATTAGKRDDSQTGSAEISGNMAVSDAAMKSWLEKVAVNSTDASTPGNPDSCDSTLSEYAQVTGALTAEKLIPIGDFLKGWALVNGDHSGVEMATTWIDSGDLVILNVSNRPLTLSKQIGSQGGQITFSSYHTADSCPTMAFWPQERVLQYLIFESL